MIAVFLSIFQCAEKRHRRPREGRGRRNLGPQQNPQDPRRLRHLKDVILHPDFGNAARQLYKDMSVRGFGILNFEYKRAGQNLVDAIPELIDFYNVCTD